MDGDVLRRGAGPIGEQQVPGPDESGGGCVDVGVTGQAPQLPLGSETGDHGGALHSQWNADQASLAQPGTEAVTEGDQSDDSHRDRPEQALQRVSEVVHHAPGAGGRTQSRGPLLDAADAVEDRFRQESVRRPLTEAANTKGGRNRGWWGWRDAVTRKFEETAPTARSREIPGPPDYAEVAEARDRHGDPVRTRCPRVELTSRA